MMTMTEETISFQTSDAQQNLALFKLGQQIYALPVEVIVQIIPLVTIMRLPQAHEAVRGLINVRGTLTPVVSLSNLLGLPEPELRLHTPILLVKYRNYTLGTIVEDVVDVLAVTNSEVEHSNDILPEALQYNTALAGLANTAKGTIYILDLAHLLEDCQNEDLLEALETLTTSNEKKTEAISPLNASAEILEKRESPEAPPPSRPSGKASSKTDKKDRKKEPRTQGSTPASAGKSGKSESDPKPHPITGANES